jgi:CheY-like chemotaxis protein/tetratricopeptide (TPR) repeat protein
MGQAFVGRTARMLLIEPSSSVRTIISDSLKELGFTEKQQVVASPQDAVGMLEVESFDWVITSLFPDEPVNGLQLLKLLTTYSGLHSTRTTFFLDDAEQWVLPQAFELGLLSWHAKTFTKEAVKAALEELVARFQRHEGTAAQVSGDYLREYLTSKKDFQALVKFEEAMSRIYTGSPRQMLRLAEAQIQVGKAPQARACLAQVRLLSEDLAKDVEKIEGTLPPSADGAVTGTAEKINVLGIESAVVVDSDETVRRSLEELLQDLGVGKVDAFGDGGSAWEHLSAAKEPGLIIHEWRIPKITGPVLVQRIRSKGFQTVPIVVVSSLIKPEDTPFVREMGVAGVQPKPFNRQEFLTTVTSTIQEERMPTDMRAMERRIRRALALGQMDEAEKLRAKFMANAGIPQGRKDQIQAEFAYANSDYEAAKVLALAALKNTKESIFPLNLLGKVFMKLGDYEAALRCYEKARNLAPQNLERLCAIAEAELHQEQAGAASETVQEAAALDPDAMAVKEATVKVATSTGDVGKARKILESMSSIEGFLSFTNNRAVSLARTGKVVEGIKLYKQAIDSIPPARKRELAVMRYNLGLAYARAGEMEDAKAELTRSVDVGVARISAKAGSLLERIGAAMKSGGDLMLRTGDKEIRAGAEVEEKKVDPAAAAEASAKKVMDEAKQAQREAALAVVEADPGALCCFMIYRPSGKPDERVAKLLAKALKYTPRDAITRDATHGVEKAMKAGSGSGG